jgi:ribosome-associated translation inhibitor RaiA
MDETAFAPLHGDSNYAAVDQAFDELGDCQSAHAAATVRFDLPASKQLANDDEANAELVGEDQVEEMFAALDEALDAALATLA